MSAQLTLLASAPAELERVPWGRTRRLPLLKAVPDFERPVVRNEHGRRLSRACLPGYRKGEKPGNYGRRYPAELLTLDEVERLLDATGNGYAGCRDRAMYAILWRCGLRLDECLSLLPRDIDLEARTVLVRHGKGNKRRVVGLDQRGFDELTPWLERREELGVGRDQPVFCVISRPTVGKKLYQSCAREQLRDCARRAGIEKRVHPHGLRHLFATELMREGVPLHIISRLLGHSSSAITAHYVDHLSPEEALNVARARVVGGPAAAPVPAPAPSLDVATLIGLLQQALAGQPAPGPRRWRHELVLDVRRPVRRNSAQLRFRDDQQGPIPRAARR